MIDLSIGNTGARTHSTNVTERSDVDGYGTVVLLSHGLVCVRLKVFSLLRSITFSEKAILALVRFLFR